MDMLVVLEQVERLTRLLNIRAQSEDEKRLARMLLLLMAMYLNGTRTSTQFRDEFLSALNKAYLGAYPGGVLTGGLDSAALHDMATAERDAQAQYLDNFLRDLKAGVVSEAQAKARAQQYATSLGKFKQQVKVAEQGTRQLQWELDPTLENCEDCIRLNGTKHPATYWLGHGLYPKSGLTRCGQNCGCTLRQVAT